MRSWPAEIGHGPTCGAAGVAGGPFDMPRSTDWRAPPRSRVSAETGPGLGQAWPSWTKGWAAPSHSLIIVKHQCSPWPHPFCPSFVPAYKLKRTETARFCHRSLATPSAVCGTYSTPNFRHEAGMGQGKSSPAYQEGCPGHAPSARGRRAAIHRQKASGGPLASLCPLSMRPLAFHVVKCPLCLRGVFSSNTAFL